MDSTLAIIDSSQGLTAINFLFSKTLLDSCTRFFPSIDCFKLFWL